ncbi:hypothetical protein, partial [Streptomyces sp. NPDC003032]
MPGNMPGPGAEPRGLRRATTRAAAQDATGTAGVLAALAAASLATGHPTDTLSLIVALALPLLSTPTSHVLTDRILETTAGAVCGIL